MILILKSDENLLTLEIAFLFKNQGPYFEVLGSVYLVIIIYQDDTVAYIFIKLGEDKMKTA